MSDADAGPLRLDKWLWFARFFKTRSLATKFVQTGKLRINSVIVSKPHYSIKVDDVLTFPLHTNIKVVKVVALGARRGPAPEAQGLYEDLSPPPVRKDDAEPAVETMPVAERSPGAGRPTKRERRETDRLRGDEA